MAATALAGRSFSERLLSFLDVVECRRLAGGEELEAVFRLRYDAYLREGAIPFSFSRRFSDTYDEAPNVWVFGVYLDGSLASSIRVHVASLDHPDAPATSVFPDILLPEIERGRVIVDPTRFVANSALSRRHPELPYVTTRLGFLASEHFAADIALATVRAEHQAFYRRTFGFRPLCPPRDYPSLAKPISLMAIHRAEFSRDVVVRYPYLRSTAEERARLFDRGPDLPLCPPLPLVAWEDAGRAEAARQREAA